MAGTSIIAASGIVLEPLTKDNYDNWSTLVKNYLQGQGLWGIVLSVSEIGVKPKAVSEVWKRRNAKALHIIQLACGSENLTHIREAETAKEAWNKLSVLYSSKLKADPDIEQGVMDDSLGRYKPLHRYIESGEWNDAKAFFSGDVTAIYSTSSSGRTLLHVAVIAGHEDIVEKLVKIGKDKLVKMQDTDGYTPLALAAELTGNTNIAKYMVEKRGGRLIDHDLLSINTNDDEIPVLLAAAKGHKQMTRYLYFKTRLQELVDKNPRNGVLLLTRCITAEIFDVALDLFHHIPQLPLAHESHDLRPLYALARMPSAFPSGTRFGLLQQFLYNILRLERPERKVQDSYGRITVIVSSAAQQKGQHKTSFAGRFCIRVLNFAPVKLLGRLLLFVHVLVQNWILLKFSAGLRELHEQKMTHRQVLEILSCLCQRISELKESQLREASAYDAMLQAAKLGIVEFIDAMRKANPDLLWAIDKNKRGIFSHAILNRRKSVFELINGVNGRKEIIKSRADAFGNTLLHLAGYLGPSSDLDLRSGAALQMQREIQWFKEVEKIVHPKCKEAKNSDDKKPREVFSESHKEMVKAGEKWAKDTASSFTLVGTLIITIMFAAAFTVPGGNNQETGVPVFLHDKLFTLFIIADAISLFTSSTAVLIFIGILTGRYAEKDFLKTLPLKLLFGLVALFLSVVSMMAAFCASLAMMLKGYQRVIIAAMSLGSIPVMVLVPSQLRLFLEIFNSTIRSK
ncbi:PGG domain [Sesbania bispinosa]|nr:PGG domain [Sesbania bispinosa]